MDWVLLLVAAWVLAAANALFSNPSEVHWDEKGWEGEHVSSSRRPTSGSSGE